MRIHYMQDLVNYGINTLLLLTHKGYLTIELMIVGKSLYWSLTVQIKISDQQSIWGNLVFKHNYLQFYVENIDVRR